MKNYIKEKFDELFGNTNGVRYFFSPGRINVIGEHIDYNGGFVLPAAISNGTYFAIRLNGTNKVNAYSDNFAKEGIVSFDVEDKTHTNKYVDYIKGIMMIFDIHEGFDVVIKGTIPHSSGLSSSASIETGFAYSLLTLLNRLIDRVDISVKCKEVENKYIGVNSGIMDQFIICNGKKDQCLLLDCNTLKFEEVPLELEDNVLVIANTNKPRQLVDSKYNERRAECDSSLELLQQNGYKISCLCELTGKDLDKVLSILPTDVLKRRVKHVISENDRTVNATKALKEHDIKKLGQYLTESHLSLENDYEVTGIELDTLVHGFLNEEGCLGARMTGAGFGGCAIAIFKKGFEEKAINKVKENYLKKIGYEPSFYQVDIAEGTHEI